MQITYIADGVYAEIKGGEVRLTKNDGSSFSMSRAAFDALGMWKVVSSSGKDTADPPRPAKWPEERIRNDDG